MATSLRKHLRNNVVGYISLFVALAGTSYAAATITGRDVVNESLKSKDLKDNAAVKSGDVRDDVLPGGGLKGRDIIESDLGKIPNADTLDNVDSRSFVSVGTSPGNDSFVGGQALELTPNQVATILNLPDWFEVRYSCPSNLATNGSVTLVNNREQPVNLFVDNGGPDPMPTTLSTPNPSTAGDEDSSGAADTGEFITFQIRWYDHHLATVWFSSVHRSSPFPHCYAQVQTLVNEYAD